MAFRVPLQGSEQAVAVAAADAPSVQGTYEHTFNPQAVSEPPLLLALSTTRMVQVPFMLWPSKADNGLSGM